MREAERERERERERQTYRQIDRHRPTTYRRTKGHIRREKEGEREKERERERGTSLSDAILSRDYTQTIRGSLENACESFPDFF